MRYLFSCFVLINLMVGSSCNPIEEIISADANLTIEVSADTVSFDTLLSGRLSHSLRLTVKNPHEKAIQFSSIYLQGGETSNYSLIINGKAKNSIQEEVLFGGDSMLIIISVHITPQGKSDIYLLEEELSFLWNNNTEQVLLQVWGVDTRAIQQQTICDEIWTNQKAILIQDTVLVSPDCFLRIEKGTKVFFEKEAALFIAGSLEVLGDSNATVTFRNTRLDGIYNETAGQWNGIYFLEGSKNNIINYAEIFNGTVGLRVGTPDEDDLPDIIVNNTSVYNMSFGGILTFNSDIVATNCLIYNCGQVLLGGYIGGVQTYKHCTVVNSPDFFSKETPAVQFSDNLILSNNEELCGVPNITLINNIIWGSSKEELLLSTTCTESLILEMKNNIIKSTLDYPNNFSSQEHNFPSFIQINQFNYQLDTLSFAKDKGVVTGAQDDFLGKRRDEMPDIGAFERIEQ